MIPIPDLGLSISTWSILDDLGQDYKDSSQAFQVWDNDRILLW